MVENTILANTKVHWNENSRTHPRYSLQTMKMYQKDGMVTLVIKVYE